MKLIVLTGLVAVEKMQLAEELATHFEKQAAKVHIIDNIARLSMKHDDFNVPVQRIVGDITIGLKDVLNNLDADIVLLAASEQVHPDDLFTSLDALSDILLEIDIRTLALLDLRTCDCFPNLREALEQYADESIFIPYQMDEVLTYVSD
jgi:hypothetical protein